MPASCLLDTGEPQSVGPDGQADTTGGVASKTAIPHPHASPISGTPPPVEHQFQPGGKGGPGRPRGAWPRAALARRLAKGWEDDTDEPDPEKRIGVEAKRVGEELLRAAYLGDRDRVMSLCDVINQVEGKPQEFIEHSQNYTARTVIVNKTTGAPPALPSVGDTP